MAHSFPLLFPTTPAPKSSSFGLKRAVAVAESPFTGAQQTHEYDFALWTAQITLPPMKREDAGNFQAFFSKLRGRRGTFLMGDPDGKTAMGSINTTTTATLHASAAIGAHELTITTSLTTNETTAFKAGDYIQLGTENDSRLYLVCENTYTGSQGRVTIHVEPFLKNAHAQGETVTFTNPVGVWRLDDNNLQWDANHVSTYGFSFSCTEAK